MSQKKRISFLFAFIVIFLLSGCAQLFNESADEGIKTYCRAILQQDDESIKKAKLSKDELQRNFMSEFVSNFIKSSGNSFTKKQATIIGYAFQDLIQKVQVETKLLAGNSSTARVEVTISQIDLNDLDYEALLREVKDKVSNLSDQDDALVEIANTYGKYIKRLEPKGKTSFTVDCKYDQDKEIWEPNNAAAFEIKLFESLFSY